MKLAKAQMAPEPRSETAKKIAWGYAVVVVVMVVLQLFSFEKFIPILGEYGLPGGERTATLLAALIVVSEVFALPSLLRMPLSVAMRWLSLGLAVLVPVVWTLLGIVAVMAGVTTNSGLLGSKLAVPAGWPQLVLSLGLAVLAGLAVRGLVPTRKK